MLHHKGVWFIGVRVCHLSFLWWSPEICCIQYVYSSPYIIEFKSLPRMPHDVDINFLSKCFLNLFETWKKSRYLWLVKNDPGQSSDLSLILRMRVFDLIIITKSEVWLICHCVGKGDETMVCAVCLSIFLLKYSCAHKWFDKYIYMCACVCGKLSMQINCIQPYNHNVCNWLFFLE